MTQSNKTNLYTSSNEDKTSLYAPAESNNGGLHQGINIGDTIVLRNNTYTIQSLISSGTGEANVYKITDNTGKPFALKLYYEFRFGDDEPNGIALQRIRQLNDADILKLYDFGVGADKYLGKYCYEISEFAQGGNLLQVENFKEKYTAEFIEQQIVSQIYLAITKLHEYKIYHCDLKPQNILYLDAAQTDLVIGDYGSAKAYDMQSEKDLRRSKIIKGTEAYLAPEQARGITSEKNDYYSFGMILLHLLYPEQLCDENNYSLIDRDKFAGIVERQYGAEPIISFDLQFERLNQLIGGLTMAYHNNRWGKKEVFAWISKKNKPSVSFDRDVNTDDNAIRVGNIIINSIDGLAAYIIDDDNFYENLFEDNDRFTTLKTWFIHNYDIAYKNTFSNLVVYYQHKGRKYLREALYRFLKPERPVVVNNESFLLWQQDDAVQFEQKFMRVLTLVQSLSDLEKKAFYEFQMEFAARQVSLFHEADQVRHCAKNVLQNYYDKLGLTYQEPEKLITLITHLPKETSEVAENTVAEAELPEDADIIEDAYIEPEADETLARQYNAIRIVESESKGIKYYGHCSALAGSNWENAWYFYFFYTEKESKKFKREVILSDLQSYLWAKGFDFEKIEHYARHMYNSNATRKLLKNDSFSEKGFVKPENWASYDKTEIYYFENGFYIPIGVDNLNLIQQKVMLLTLYVVYPLDYQINPTKHIHDNAILGKKGLKKTDEDLFTLIPDNPDKNESETYNVKQYFGKGEYEMVLSIVNAYKSLAAYAHGNHDSDLKRCNVETALLGYYLFFKYTRTDSQRILNPKFSIEAYNNNISKLLTNTQTNCREDEEIIVKNRIDSHYRQMKNMGWEIRRNVAFQNNINVDLVTYFNSGPCYLAYSVMDCVSDALFAKSFAKLLTIYNQYSSIRYFGILDVQMNEWLLFGDYYYQNHGNYYLEMKDKYPLGKLP